MSLRSLLGQPRAVEILRSAVAAGKAHHGYLFEGPEGVGKATAARALAMALNCERRDPSGCGQCDSCRKIAEGNHPDVIPYDMTPKGLTERVRELVGLLGFRPHEGRARVVIFDPADELAGPQDTHQPANVLLKTLEEPPADTHFVLVTAQPKRLPITVRSRCQRIRFLPLDEPTIEQLLVGEHGASPASARAAAAQAAGSPGRALALLGEDVPPSFGRVEELVKAARRADPRAMFEVAAQYGGAREEADITVGALWTTLRDALLSRQGLAQGRVPAARVELAGQLLGDVPSSALMRGLDAAEEAALSLKGNVAPQLVLEHLMLALGRERRA